jgi:hypothetical protein
VALPRFGGLLWKKRKRRLAGWQKQRWTSVQAGFFFIKPVLAGVVQI